MKISVVMSYYRRIRELESTLNSIRKTSHKDFEVIIVDDGTGDGEHSPVHIPQKFEDLNITLLRVNPEDKWWVNPCVPFNVGFHHASGDVVLIQSPESYHNGDVLSHVAENLKENEYYSYGCYSLDPNITNILINGTEEQKKAIENLDGLPTHGPSTQFIVCNADVKEAAAGRDIESLDRVPQVMPGENGWYNHSTHRATYYHFMSAIYNSHLKEMGGFDERYAHGLCWDDNEFVYRIRNKELEVKIVDDPFCFHQYHYGYSNNIEECKAHASAGRRLEHTNNRTLYDTMTVPEKGVEVNCGNKKRTEWFKNEPWHKELFEEQ